MSQISNNALLSFALDLASAVTQQNRFSELIHAIRSAINCDAVVLLVHSHGVLTPLAQKGLSDDLMGRRFIIDEHPRFKAICEAYYPIRFPSDSSLPDPYDGMVLGHEGHLKVHSCMGIPLHIEGRLIGVVTLDSVTPGVFEDIYSRTLEVIATMAAITLNTAMLMEKLEDNNLRAQHVFAAMNEQVRVKDGGEMIGQSDAMSRLNQVIDLVAASDLAILIEGETGVGKELVARKIHQESNRSSAPMVYVNCASIPDNLIESELFGHVKGAFTGANSDRQGKFLLADGGTLFLDEIGELPIEVQGSLLRAIQNQEIQAVGKDQVRKVDVRIIVATNRHLETEVNEKRFRADLFHRLSVFPIQVPALRERTGDIPLLVGFFAEGFRRKLGLQQLTVSSSAIELLEGYHWPGNVRELEHTISRASLFAKAEAPTGITTIMSEHIVGLQIDRNESKQKQKSEKPLFIEQEKINFRLETESYQKTMILAALKKADGNWSKASHYLSMDRANLARLAKRLGIKVTKTVE
ncbi:nitric oxide reductase transcriptional regulator NorR [Marinomonas sp. C2222]|uniref:Nitric oxide reductase transcriptional regulator NorR n=1 Tax=Marinomonas sargassi TaxID=2984494 RepID=A0ABT2YQ23_9GAMM|nr:nitric oxide reductase transcriptional regulator NorR [Marinomonas sargassi]MCV2401996.1 nitric oxide reductase transcriptional regulator NorR [Marinomonas sargassi]